MIKKKYKNIYKALVIISLFLFITSCSSRDEGFNQIDNKPSTYLKIHVGGINENNEIPKTVYSKVKDNTLKDPKPIIFSGSDFSASISINEGSYTPNTFTSKNNNFGATASVKPVPIGTKYRIILKDTTTGEIINRIGSSGTDPEIKVNDGTVYNWYIYSLNDTTTTPPDIDANGVIPANTITNKDLAYKSGTITINAGENYMNTILDHKTVKYLVNIDTTGLFATVDNTTKLEIGTGPGATFTSIMQTGDFNIFTNAYTSTLNISAITGDHMSGTNVKTAIIYTKNTTPIPAGELSVRLNTLDIVFGSGDKKSFPNTTLQFTSGNAISPTIGTAYTINTIINGATSSGQEVTGSFGPFFYQAPGTYNSPILFSKAGTGYGTLASNGLVILDGRLGGTIDTYRPAITNVSNGNITFNLKCKSPNNFGIDRNFTLAAGSTQLNIDADNIVYYGGLAGLSDHETCDGSMSSQATGKSYNVSFKWRTTGSGWAVQDNYLNTSILIN
ncbi:TPA: hypothetical protein ACGZ9U_001688 [Elizabethkingia anophelis]